MPNTGLADLSNATLVFAIVLYALAMLAYACDFAFGKRQNAAAGTAAVRREPELAAARVGAGVGAGNAFPADPGDPTELADLTGSAEPPDEGSADDGQAGTGNPTATGSRAAAVTLPEPAPMAVRTSPWPQGPWLRSAFLLTCAGLVLHAASVASRGLSEHRVPWGNMYEFIAAITCAVVLVYVLAAIRFRAYYLGLFVMVTVVLALAVDILVIYIPAGSLVPALQSYWIAIHVTAMIVAIGTYVFGAVVTVLYLLADRYERRVAAGQPSSAAGIMERLPASSVLDKLAYRAILFAFPAWTFAVIAGAIWADHAWGRYWGWDPKETWSFITWLVYAAFLHARATAGWRGRRAALIQMVGFACLIFNLIGVNLWVHGLHSYAGLSG